MPDSADTPSELSTIARLNGDFRKNYGTLLGAFLYLRSISAARGRSFLWTGLVSVASSAGMAWLWQHGAAWLNGGQGP
jgi:hypothetical protein